MPEKQKEHQKGSLQSLGEMAHQAGLRNVECCQQRSQGYPGINTTVCMSSPSLNLANLLFYTWKSSLVQAFIWYNRCSPGSKALIKIMLVA